jgi:hypothetical protein
LEDEANEDEDMGDDKEPVEMHCKTPKGKERLEEIIIGYKCLKSMVSNNDVDTEVALMVTETKEGSNEGFATEEEEEEEEEAEEAEEEEEKMVDLNESLWGQCPECNSKGPLGLFCLRCEDTGLI